MAEKAAGYGVTLCCKAHVGACIFNTPTTLRAMKKIKSRAFGIDMDPSHIYRAGEDPAEALARWSAACGTSTSATARARGPARASRRTRPAGAATSTCSATSRSMVEGGYNGPVCLEVIGAKDYELSCQAIIAAESYGYMNACLKALGAR